MCSLILNLVQALFYFSRSEPVKENLTSALAAIHAQDHISAWIDCTEVSLQDMILKLCIIDRIAFHLVVTVADLCKLMCLPCYRSTFLYPFLYFYCC